ncbi:MAG: glyoxalase [Lachnospiraceae bacterium]|jgi:hypothetical protein|nr:glyoxalase [Lachnospiraceae bacterium]
MYDDAVLKCFLDNQSQLFPDDVVSTLDEAEKFLEENFAVVVDNTQDVITYFEESDADTSGESEEEILSESEVFDVGDGRYLIVEG